MNNLIELKYYFDFNQNGGYRLAEFIPYSDHAKMDESNKEKNPYYCPDMFPFLCNKKSNAAGLCRKLENECNRSSITGESNKFPIKYQNNKINV